MSHSNPFQPWKPHPPNLFNTTSGNYMQYHSIPPPAVQQQQQHQIQNYSTLHNHQIADQVSTSTPSILPITPSATSNFNNNNNASKGGPNYHKINNVDKMVGLDSLVDEQIDNSPSTSGGMSREERNHKLKQFAEKNIR